MQSTDIEEIKAALWEQAYHPCTLVKWRAAQVMAVRYNRGQFLAQLRGWNGFRLVDSVTIERVIQCTTGACDPEGG